MANITATSCVSGPLPAGGAEADPGLAFFGSQQKKKSRKVFFTQNSLRRNSFMIFLHLKYYKLIKL
ncbi:TPA: hypothetical protein ACUJC4_004609 [Salmonella enterica]